MEKYDKYFARYKKACDDEIKLIARDIKKKIYDEPKITLWYA